MDILTLSRSRGRLEAAKTRLGTISPCLTPAMRAGFRTSKLNTLQIFMVCIRRSGESGLTQGVLFPLHYHQTIQGTISRFHILLANFWLPFDVGKFFGLWQSPCITQAVTNLKAGQSWGPEKVCLQPSICSGVNRDACRHSKHFKQPLDSLSSAFYFGPWILKDFRLCTYVLFRSSFWILDIGHDRFSSG